MAKFLLFLMVTVVAWRASKGGLDVCNLKQQDMEACQPAVATSDPTDPSPVCCKAVNALTVNDIQCLCDYKKNEPFLLRYFGVDPDRCLQLPTLCESPVPVNC